MQARILENLEEFGKILENKKMQAIIFDNIENVGNILDSIEEFGKIPDKKKTLTRFLTRRRR